MAKLVLGTDINNTGTSSIVTEKPVPMPYSIQFNVDENGKITKNNKLIDFSGVSILGDYVFSNLYKRVNFEPNETYIDMSSVTKTEGNYSMEYMFSNSNITGVDLSNLESIDVDGLSHSFEYCTNLTSIDLRSLKIFKSVQELCSNCTNLTSVNLSSVKMLGDNQSNSGCIRAFYRCTNLETLDLSSAKYASSAQYLIADCSKLTSIDCSNIQSYKNCNYLFYNPSLTNLDLSGAKTISSGYLCYNMSKLETINLDNLIYPANMERCFQDCKKITTLSFPSCLYRQSVSGSSNIPLNFTNMLSGCSNVTVHFPQEWETDMSTWSSFQNGFGGTNTTILFDLPNNPTSIYLDDLCDLDEYFYDDMFNSLFIGCTKLVNVNIPSLEHINASSACNNMFQGCTSLTNVDLSNLKNIGSYDKDKNAYKTACSSMFKNCTSLESVDLSSLESLIGGSYMFNGCTSLVTFSFPSLKTLDYSQTLQYTFKDCTSLTSLSFPALKNVKQSGIFNYMLQGVTGCTVHFPSNLESLIGQWVEVRGGFHGTNTTVLFDLPATE